MSTLNQRPAHFPTGRNRSGVILNAELAKTGRRFPDQDPTKSRDPGLVRTARRPALGRAREARAARMEDAAREKMPDAASAWRRRETNRSGDYLKLLVSPNLCASPLQLQQNAGLTNRKAGGIISDMENIGLFERRLSAVRSEREGFWRGCSETKRLDRSR
jgi:hypothetical protein